nr:site-specific integrase [Tunicatimonas sp. TK19036]
MTANNPFEDFTLSDPEYKTKDVLTSKEVNQLYKLLKEGGLPGYLHNTLHFFLLSCYTGLRDRDLLQCQPANIVDDQLMVKLHKGQRGKKKTVGIPIHQKSKELIQKVEREHREPFTNQVANRYLKDVMLIAGVSKHMSMHCGRHSFAVIGLNEMDWSMELTSHLLGHSSIDVTRKHYAKYQNTYKAKMMKRWDSI